MKRCLVFLVLLIIGLSAGAVESLGTIRDATFYYVTSVDSSLTPTVRFYRISDTAYSTPTETIPLESINTDVSWGSPQYSMRYNQNGADGSYTLTLTFTPFSATGYDPIGYHVLMYSNSTASKSCHVSAENKEEGQVFSMTSEALSSQTVFTLYYRFESSVIDLLPADKEFSSSVTVTMEAV